MPTENDPYQSLVDRFSDMLGFYGEDGDEAGRIIDEALEEGFSNREIKEAYKEARAEYLK